MQDSGASKGKRGHISLSTESDGNRRRGSDGKTKTNEKEQVNIEEEHLDFEDPFGDEFEEEQLDEDDEQTFEENDDENDEEKAEAVNANQHSAIKADVADGNHAPKQVWRPGIDQIAEGEALEYDPSAYVMYHSLQTEWPCLSFDIPRDNLGESRQRVSGNCVYVSMLPSVINNVGIHLFRSSLLQCSP
jgi:ribosome assembly protein RRB1